MRLSGKISVITGAARGIGRACALEFARQGSDLVLLDIARDNDSVPYPMGSASQLAHTALLCREFGASVLSHQSDITSQSAVDEAVGTAISRFGRIDILCNSAGIAAPSGKVVHEVSEGEWNTMLNVNLTGAWRMIRSVGAYMVQRRSGSIVNVASTAGLVGYRNFSGYVAAKHGLVGLTKAVALDYGPSDVRVNAVCPGSVKDSEIYECRMLREIARSLGIEGSQYESVFSQAQPMNRLIDPEDVAKTCVWLGSDESVQVTGSIVPVDGGFLAK